MAQEGASYLYFPACLYANGYIDFVFQFVLCAKCYMYIHVLGEIELVFAELVDVLEVLCLSHANNVNVSEVTSNFGYCNLTALIS